MKLPYVVQALILGLLVFAAIEVSSLLLGLVTAMSPWALVDAAAYAVAMLLLAVALAPLLRRSSGWTLPAVALLFLLLYPLLTAGIAAALELTLSGDWGSASLVRGTFITTPINLIVTFVVELWFVALPLTIASVLLLWRRARRRPGASTGRAERTAAPGS